jgi:hypothetical protein
MSKYSHTISKLKPSHTLINFEESLRCTQGKDDMKEKQWWSFPKVDHKDNPKLLAKVNSFLTQSSITKTKNPDLCSALDPQSNYPPYT